jgi:hypothetical protein
MVTERLAGYSLEILEGPQVVRLVGATSLSYYMDSLNASKFISC